MKKVLLLTVLLVVFPLLFAIVSNQIIVNTAEGKTYFDTDQIESNRVGMVLGTSKYRAKGGINLYFKYRIDAVVELYNSRKLAIVLVSRSNSTLYYNEPEAFKEKLVKRGIPAEKIFLDYAGFRTLDSVVRAKKIFGQVKLTIISQKFHSERAVYLAERSGVDAVGFNGKDVSTSYGFKTAVREYFARSKAVIECIFGVNPNLFGEPITIK